MHGSITSQKHGGALIRAGALNGDNTVIKNKQMGTKLKGRALHWPNYNIVSCDTICLCRITHNLSK